MWIQGSWEENRGNEAGCRVQWKVHRMCLNIVLWLFPISAFSLQLGHRFLEGRHPARDICMPNGTFVSSHRANGSVQTCWAEWGWGGSWDEWGWGGSQGRKGELPSTWRLGLGSLCLENAALLADAVTWSLHGSYRSEATWWKKPKVLLSPQSSPSHVSTSEEPKGAGYSWILFLLILWARTPGLINTREDDNLQSFVSSLCSPPGCLPEEQVSFRLGTFFTQHIFFCY